MHERILEKAKRLGINIYSSNRFEQLEEIAMQIGINDFSPNEDMDILEENLDLKLKEVEIDNSQDDYDEEYLGDEIDSLNESNVVREKNNDSEKDYNKVREESDVKSPPIEEERKKDVEDTKEQSTKNNSESSEVKKSNSNETINKKEKPENGSKNNNPPVNNLKNKNVFDKKNGNNNLSKLKNERLQQKISSAKNKAQPVEMTKNKVKTAAKEGMKKTGKAVAKATGKAAKAVGKAIVSLIKRNPYVLLILLAIALVIFLILFITTLSENADTRQTYYEKTCDFNNTIVVYNYCNTGLSDEVELDTFVVGVVSNLLGDRELENINTYRALVIAVKTKVLSMGNYNNENQKITIDGCNLEYSPQSVTNKIGAEIINKMILPEVGTYLYLSKSYTGTITNLSSENDLNINVNDFNREGGYSKILKEIYQNDDLALYNIADQCKQYLYGTANTKIWWPIGSSNVTIGNNIYGGDPTATRVSSPFGMRLHPVHGDYRMHNGIDIAASCGEVLIAVKPGTVKTSISNCVVGNSGCGGGYGNYIIIEHEDGISSVYAHMQTNSATVKSGDKVAQGEKIGLVGTTGTSTGCHLHFEIRNNGQRVDPLEYINAENTRPILESTNNGGSASL